MGFPVYAPLAFSNTVAVRLREAADGVPDYPGVLSGRLLEIVTVSYNLEATDRGG